MIEIEDMTETNYQGDREYLLKSIFLGIPNKMKLTKDGLEAKSDEYFNLNGLDRVLKRIKLLGFEDRSTQNGKASGVGIKYSFIDELGTKLKLVLAYTDDTKDVRKLRLKVNCY